MLQCFQSDQLLQYRQWVQLGRSHPCCLEVQSLPLDRLNRSFLYFQWDLSDRCYRCFQLDQLSQYFLSGQ